MIDVGHGLIDIRNTFGAVFLGAMISLPLTGLTTLQTYYYYNTYPKDSRSMKLLVLGMWLLDLGHSGLVIATMWYYFVLQYGNIFSLLFASPLIYASVTLNLITATIAQLFFAWRIYILASRKTRWWLWSFLVVLVIGHVVFGLITIVGLFKDLRITHITDLTRWVIPFSVFSLLGDVSIAGCLCIMLQSRRTAFRGTNKILNSLVLYAINRCLLTSASALAETIMFVVWPASGWFIAIDFVIGKLYVNSLLATLNARRALQVASANTSGSRAGTRDIPLTGLRFGGPVSSDEPTSTTLNAIGSGPSTAAGIGAPVVDVPITKSEIARHETYLFEGEDVDFDDEMVEQKSSYIVA